jgi:hypothetical protein
MEKGYRDAIGGFPKEFPHVWPGRKPSKMNRPFRAEGALSTPPSSQSDHDPRQSLAV